MRLLAQALVERKLEERHLMSGVMATPVLYRIIKANLPTPEDFTSRMMLGFPPRRNERVQPELWTGLPMYDSLAQAQATAQAYPVLAPSLRSSI